MSDIISTTEERLRDYSRLTLTRDMESVFQAGTFAPVPKIFLLEVTQEIERLRAELNMVEHQLNSASALITEN
jgi:hypothetical protein